MDTRELTRTTIRYAVGVAAAIVTGMTALGFLLGWLDPSLAGGTRPHPTLTGSVGTAASILFTNLRVLASPFLLAWIGMGRSRAGRHVGDVLLVALAASSTVLVGVELGRWQGRLMPYIPQLPIEWAALAVALSAWVLIRTNPSSQTRLPALAATAIVLVVIAAGIETWCTPHLPTAQTATRPAQATSAQITSQVGDAGCFRSGVCAASGTQLQGHPFPFPHTFGSARPDLGGADRAHNNHRPPQEGSTK